MKNLEVAVVALATVNVGDDVPFSTNISAATNPSPSISIDPIEPEAGTLLTVASVDREEDSTRKVMLSAGVDHPTFPPLIVITSSTT